MIENGRLKGVKFKKAHASGGAMSPRFIVCHDTAGRLDPGSSVNWFCDKKCGVSAHFVVERDGTITQMVETNRKAFHAGQSEWKGVHQLNSCSVGIEIVNPGTMDKTGKAWFGACCAPGDIVRKKTKAHGDGWWLSYTPEQIAAVVKICRAVIEEYPDCNEIVTHWMISPGRKIDTNPLFPLDEVRAAVFHPAESETVEAPAREPAPPPSPVVPAQPSPTKEIVTEGAKSKSVRMLILGFFAWLEQQFGFLRSALPDAQTAVDEVTSPITSLGGLLKVNVATITAVVSLVVIVVVIYRHSQDKAKLKKLKSKTEQEEGEPA